MFIRGRCIQDNFLYVQNLVRHFHRCKTPAIRLKLDVEKVFDTVSWPYLLDSLHARGFSSRWCNWISIILSSSSSRVLLNGIEGEPILHHRGLRQGDPLSPLLFILAMEPLQRILALAMERGLLSPLKGRVARLQSSLYADDATIFLNPLATDVWLVKAILERFGLAYGLRINFRKSATYPIRCGGIDVASVLAPLGVPTAALPCKYLGLPLSTRQLRRVDWQDLIDKIASRLATWKGKLMSAAGRLALLNVVLSSIPVYWLSVHRLPIWVRKKIDPIRPAWLWHGEVTCNGGHCKVAWGRICRLRDLGGLGILNLDRFSTALRLRWLWHECYSRDRPWVGTPAPAR
jgi:hypothetical protein